jgi:serine protease SohB
MLDPFQPADPGDEARLDVILQDLHTIFRSQVEARRGSKLKADDPDLFSGAFWTANQALERGLIDGIGHFRPVLRQRFGEKVKIIPIKIKQPLLRRLGFGGFGAEDWVDGIMARAEERFARQRFGG